MSDPQCGNGRYCDGGMCRNKRRNGEPCSADRECLLGVCLPPLLGGAKVCVAL
jgi:hypothetical protein